MNRTERDRIDEVLRPIESQTVNGYPRYSSPEMDRRYRELSRIAQESEVSAVLICSAGHLNSPIQYFSNWPSLTASYLLVPSGEAPELYVRLWNHLPNARDISVVEDVRFGGETHGAMLTQLAQRLRSLDIAAGRIGLVGRFDYLDIEYLRGECGVEVVSLNEQYLALRRQKSEEELLYVRAASLMGDLALEALRDGLRPGLKEYELEKIVQDAYLGTRTLPVINFFVSTSMAQPDRCVPRQLLSDRVIQPGDVIATEISASYWGYSGQVLRTICMGQPTEPFARMHEVALSTYESLKNACVPGTSVGRLLDLADEIDEAGFSIWDDLLHGYGGGGYLSPVLRTHQTGGADVDPEVELGENWVVIVQPNVITKDAAAGVQVGNGVVVRPDGPEVLQQFPTELVVCG